MKDDPQPEINLSYPIGQLGQALVTASGHEDSRTRRRALVRAQRWQSVLAGAGGWIYQYW
jgi:hypothetical protein